jgi:hypothetical protein
MEFDTEWRDCRPQVPECKVSSDTADQGNGPADFPRPESGGGVSKPELKLDAEDELTQ